MNTYITEETKATEIDKKSMKIKAAKQQKISIFSNCQSNDFIFTHKQKKSPYTVQLL